MAKTVIDVLEATAHHYGQTPAVVELVGGRWTTKNWSDHRDEIFLAARGLIHLGVQAGDGVVIMGYNCPQWFVADIAAIAVGAVPTGIYTTSTVDQTRYIADHCAATVAVLEDASYLAKLDRENLPRLQHVVLMKGTAEDGSAHSWENLLEFGATVPESDLRDRVDALDPEDLCTLIYTSGTTGSPKGVMLSHTNLVWTAGQVIELHGCETGDSIVSYLPLSHIAEQIVSLHGPMSRGCTTWFAESVEKLPDALRACRPQLFLGVPRVWEKIQAKMQAVGAQAPPLRRRIAAWARRVGLAGGYADQQGASRPLLYGLANRLVFSKVRKQLGLDRARICVTSAAPISKATLEFFLSLGIPVLEVYGMSECSGPATFSVPGHYITGSAGRSLPDCELSLAEDGEVLIRGPHVFLGYYKNEEATRETLDDEGWIHSGDIGTLDGNGYLWITDRKKELLITAGGKNVAPQPLEANLKGIPGVAQAVVLGDRQKYIAALLVLDEEMIPDLAMRLGSAAHDLDSANACAKFRNHVQKGVDELNSHLAHYETIKRFEFLDSPLTVETSELTPTMKLKRRVIAERRSDAIGRLYE
ncbi:MAG: AMP-binding protein [Thermoanaerobaculia bacterium]|nr:AMP-binding protein [Thermoanaerobaculia bacterium]